MDLSLSLNGLQDKLSSDPIRQHLIKKMIVLVVSAIFALTAWFFLAQTLFHSVYKMDSVASPKDAEILAQTNAAVDLTMQLVSTTSNEVAAPVSFGEEVQVKTVVSENPFIPLVRPAKVTEAPAQPPEPAPEDQLTLRGLAKIGKEYMAIIADATGTSQVVYQGAVFNGWKVKMLKANTVQLTKGKRSMTLAWEGI